MIIESTYGKAREQLKNFWIVRSTTVEMVLVRRRSGGTVAMIAADERQSLVETAHLLRSPKNTERLPRALARARAGGKVAPTPLEDIVRRPGLQQ